MKKILLLAVLVLSIIVANAQVTGNLDFQVDVTCFGNCDGSATVSATTGASPFTYLWDDPGVQTTQTATGLCAGMYNVTITDFNSAFDVVSVTINEPPQITATINSIIDVTCNGSCDGEATVMASGGVGGFTYFWDAGSQITTTAIGMCPGNIYVTVTDANGCNAINSVTINEPPLLMADAGADLTMCAGDISLLGGSPTASGGVSPYTYSWDNPGDLDNATLANPNASPLVTTSYNVTVTDIYSCMATAVVLVTVDPAPTVFAGSDQSVCANNPDVSLSGSFSNSLGVMWTTAGTGTFSPTDTDANTIYIPSGSDISMGYVDLTLTTTGNGLCSAVNDMMMITYTTDPIVYAGADQMLCESSPATILNGSVSGGSATGLWTGGAGMYNPSNTTLNATYTPTAGEITAGTITLTLTSTANGTCLPVSDDIMITYNSAPMVDAGFDNTICSGDVVMIGGAPTASGGMPPYTYTWDNSASLDNGTLANPSASPLVTTQYTVVVNDSYGCQATNMVNVTVNSILSLSSSVVDVSCNGLCDGSASVVASGGTPAYYYLWDDPGTQTSPTASGLCPGTYSVTVTDNIGCSASDIVTVNEPAQLAISELVSDVTVVSGMDGSIDITIAGGTMPYSYLWSNSSTLEDLAGISAGTYDVTVYDAIGCFVTGSYVVNEPGCSMTATISSFTDVTCIGACNGEATVIPVGGTSPYFYMWDDMGEQPTATATGLCAGLYNVIVTDNVGCQASASATITDPPVLTASIAAVELNCFDDCNGAATATATGGSGSYTYNWDNTSGSITATTSADLCGNTTYTVTVADAIDPTCIVISTVIPVEPSVLTIVDGGASHQDISCYGASDGSLTSIGSGGTLPYQYSIDGGATWQGGNVFTGLAPNTYSLDIQDANMCQATTSTVISEPSALSVGVSISDVSIFGGSDGYIMTNVIGGTTPYTFLWSTSATTANVSGLGVGFHTLTVTDFNGCESIGSYTVTEPEDLGCDIIPSFTYAVGGSNLEIVFTNTSVGTFDQFYWTFGDFTTPELIDNPTHLYAEGGYFTVQLTLINTSSGCEETFVQTIFVDDPVVESCAAYFDAFVDDNALTVSIIDQSTASTSVSSWSWDFGNGTSSVEQNPTVVYYNQGEKIINLSITDASGTCTDVYSLSIQVGIPPCTIEADFTATVANMDATFFNNSTNATGASFEWNFDDGFTSTVFEPTHTYVSSGTYDVTLTVTNAGGSCIDLAVKQIVVGSQIPPIVEIINNTPDVAAGSYVDLFADVLNYNTADEANLDYFWVLGDGSYYDTQDVLNHHFPNGGTYSIELVVTDPVTGLAGIAQTDILVIGGDDISNVDFVYSGAPGTVTFSALDAISGVNLYPFTYSWNFGDGSAIETGQLVTHDYTADDVYNVCLNATNSMGVSSMVCKNVVIHSDPGTAPCVAVMTYSVLPAQYKVDFWSTQSTGNPADYDFLWDFGDGTTSDQVNPNHTYAAPDYYLASLTITNVNTGCTHTAIEYVNVGAGNNGLQGSFVSQQNEGTGLKANEYSVDFVGAAFGEPAAASWDFDDGSDNDTTSMSPTHTYNAPGEYNVCMTISDPFSGLEDTYCDSIDVVDPLKINYRAANDILQKVYPNPFRDELTVQLNTDNISDITIELTDVLGRQLDIVELNGNNGIQLVTFTRFTETMSEGFYFLKVTADQLVSSHKLIRK